MTDTTGYHARVETRPFEVLHQETVERINYIDAEIETKRSQFEHDINELTRYRTALAANRDHFKEMMEQ